MTNGLSGATSKVRGLFASGIDSVPVAFRVKGGEGGNIQTHTHNALVNEAHLRADHESNPSD